MANIFFNPTTQSLPSSEAQDFSVEATYSFAGELPDTMDDFQIGEVSTPEGVTQNSRTLITSTSQEQVYAYSFHTDANTSSFERMIGLQFSILRTGGDGVLKLYPVPQPGQSTPVTSPSLSLSPAQVRFLSSEVSVASVTASMYNTGSTVSLTPTSPSWVTVNPVNSYQQGNAYVKTYLLTASANQGATARDSFVSFSLNTAGETVNKSVSVFQPGRASILVPTVNWATNLFEFESEGASVGTVAYISGTVENSIRVTGDHTPIVDYTTTNNVITASIQFNVPANSLPTTRSTYMTVSAWNSAGTASSVLEIRTAGTDTPTPGLPTGSIVVESGNHITASANANSTNFTVRYVNAEAGQYTIDGAGGFSGMDNPVSQSTIIDGNDIVVTYRATFPNNLEAYPVTRRAAFQMHRGEGASTEYVYGQADIYQEGVYAPGGAGVIIQNTPVSVAANVTQSTLFVTYSNALQNPWVIQQPSFSLGAYLISSTSRDSGQDTIRSYTIGYPANQTTNPVTHSAFFKMSYGQYHDEDTAYVHQAAASPSPQFSIRCTGSVSRDNSAFAARCWVDYMGVAYPDDVHLPTWNGTITNVAYRGYTPIDGGVKITYDITASANQTSGPVYSVITWSTSYGNVSATTTITQSSGPGPDPGTPEIVVPGNPFNLASGDQIVTFTATYKNSYPGWTVRTAGTSKPDMHIVSSSVQVVGSDQQVTYEVTFPGNAGDLPVDRRVFLEMTSGSGVAENERKTLNVRIIQAGRLQVGSIHLQPSRAWVAYSDTQSTFFATYSFNGLAYEIQNPVGNRCSVTTVDTRTLENGDQVYQYRVTFPTNPSTNTPISRSVDCRMTTGSITAIETYIVAQDYQGGGGSKQILVNPTSKWIEHDQVTATTQVTYMGFSSAAQVSTPSCPSGWTATVGNVQESSGQVVINWIFTGTPNTGTGTKTNTFTIGATGATSKTFTVFQYGTGGGGGGGTENTLPVWKRNIISSSAASSRLRITHNSQEIFNERVYAAPDSDHVEVDLNKICDPFVTHLDFWTPGDKGYDSVAVYYPLYLGFDTYPISKFEASFDSGENYVSYILNDRSYDLIKPCWISRSVYLNSVSPRTLLGRGYYSLGNNVGLNQINTFTVENQTNSSISIDLSGPNISRTVTIPAHSEGIVWSVARKCGEYSFTIGNKTYSRVVSDSRSKWAVYFWNSLGGLDTLPLYGPVVPSIDVSRNNYLQGIYNYTRSYLNGVVSRWRCNTGTFPDEWAPMVREMIASPEIGLHDLETDNIYITRAITNSIEEKTFWNQGRKFATYQFDLESILTQERR